MVVEHGLFDFFRLLSPLLMTQGVANLEQIGERHLQYKRAFWTSKQLDKPLLVIGRPKTPWNHPCSPDVTVDIDPAVLRDCPVGGTVADVRDLPFTDKEFGASFASHVLEHLPIPDISLSWKELHRVSHVVFVAGPREGNILASLIPDHTSFVYQLQDGSIRVNPFNPKLEAFILLPSAEGASLFRKAARVFPR